MFQRNPNTNNVNTFLLVNLPVDVVRTLSPYIGIYFALNTDITHSRFLSLQGLRKLAIYLLSAHQENDVNGCRAN